MAPLALALFLGAWGAGSPMKRPRSALARLVLPEPLPEQPWLAVRLHRELSVPLQAPRSASRWPQALSRPRPAPRAPQRSPVGWTVPCRLRPHYRLLWYLWTQQETVGRSVVSGPSVE